MKNKQYIFCLETNKKANTDWLYIRKILDHLNSSKQVFDKYTPLYMNGKNNYNSRFLIKNIKDSKNMYNGESVVIYCIDLDDYNIDYKTKEFIEAVERYCDDNGYSLIYFCRNIEEVFLGKIVSKEEKVKYAIRFSKQGLIDGELLKRLNSNTKALRTSNFIMIWNKQSNK